MAKKLQFTKIDASVVELLNKTLELQFVGACERKALRDSKKSIEKKISELKDGESRVEYDNKLRVIESKRKSLSAYIKESLMDTKDENKVTISGLYSKLGINSDFIDSYVELSTSGKFGKFKDSVKTMLSEVYGIDCADKLAGKFASYLEHVVGLKLASDTKLMNGTLVTTMNNSAIQKLFVNAIAQYIANYCDDVIIPTTEKYNVVVKYATTNDSITNYALTENVGE